MTRNVAGDRIEVESLTKPGAEIHGYEPTPQDLVRLQGADIILDNGMNLEKWAAKLYQNSKDVPHVTLTEGIEPMGIAEGPYKDKPNPHAWMSPANALIYVDNIMDALIRIDEGNADYYKQRAAEYKTQIKEVDTTLKRELGVLTDANRYLTSCEGAFSYLIRDYGLKELYLWPINADAQGTPQQIRHVVETVSAKKIPAVFCESTVNDKAQRQVAQESGSHFGGVFYVDSLSGKDGPTPTYLKMLEYNADVLIKGLKKESV
jgi:manganese transport system substrate-binding protein